MKWVIFVWSDSPLPPEEISPEDFIVCADSGLDYALRWGYKPRLVLGDFDSVRADLPDVETIRLPAEKDDTDGMFAVRLGLERGFDRIMFAGGAGGRPDHFLGALTALNYAAQRGARATLSDGRVFLELLKGPAQRSYEPDSRRYFSVLAWGGSARGVTLTGMKYPLQKGVLTPDYPLGVSNELVGRAAVSVEEGTLLILRCGDKKEGNNG